MSDDLARLVREQNGVMARWQVNDPRLRERVYRELRSRSWQAPHRGIYVNHSGPLSEQQRLWCALLRCGPGAVLAGRTAAALGGLTGFGGSPIEVAVPRSRRGPDFPGVQVRRLRRLVDLTHPTKLPARMRLPDALIDAASRARTDDDAHALLCAGVQQRLSLPSVLEDAITRREQLPRLHLLQESLLDIAGGCQSHNEIAFLRAAAEAGLPKPALQVHVTTPERRAYIDGGWPEYDVWYEIDGALHAEVSHWMSDLDRANELAIEQGGTRLRWPGYVVRRHPDRAIGQALRALERAGFA